MRRTNLDRLRAAAERRHLHSTRPTYQDRRRSERRAETELVALLDAIESGEPLPSGAHPRALSEREERIQAEILDAFDARRKDLIVTAATLRAAGYENDLTRAVEAAGLMPEEPQHKPDTRGA